MIFIIPAIVFTGMLIRYRDSIKHEPFESGVVIALASISWFTWICSVIS